MVEQQTQAVKPQLYMFYGLLNFDTLAQCLPFPEELSLSTKGKRIEYLQTRAVALSCPGWSRVFASSHASVQKHQKGCIKTFGVYLNPEEIEVTDAIEAVGYYYDRITVPVILHRKGQKDEKATANVYQMKEENYLTDTYEHENDFYVRKCAASDLAHYDLQGLQAPEVITVEVWKVGPMYKLRKVTSYSEKIREGIFDAQHHPV